MSSKRVRAYVSCDAYQDSVGHSLSVIWVWVHSARHGFWMISFPLTTLMPEEALKNFITAVYYYCNAIVHCMSIATFTYQFYLDIFGLFLGIYRFKPCCCEHSLIKCLNCFFCTGIWPINKQCCDSFRWTAQGLSHTYTCIHSPLNSPPIQAAT